MIRMAVITAITLGPSEGNRILKKKVLGPGLEPGAWLLAKLEPGAWRHGSSHTMTTDIREPLKS